MLFNNRIGEALSFDKRAYTRACGCRAFFAHIKSNTIDDQWYIWKYIKNLRFAEYYKNRSGFISYLLRLYYYSRLRKYGRITGFQIPPNTVGKGITIWHWGPIIVNPSAKIGNNCTIYPGVLIGHKEEGLPAPIIGDNVFIGSGAKIIGDILIGDNVIIGPNTVIVKNVPSDSVVVGNPPRIVKQNGERVNIFL